MFKNLKFIQGSLLKTIGFFISVFSIICVILGYPQVGLSAFVGGAFSYASFILLLKSQTAILKQSNPQLVFIPLLLRLGVYGIPLSLGMFFTNYLKLWVILIFLLSFQVSYVVWELCTNIKRYKKRQK